jgi:hypothetical protein
MFLGLSHCSIFVMSVQIAKRDRTVTSFHCETGPRVATASCKDCRSECI